MKSTLRSLSILFCSFALAAATVFAADKHVGTGPSFKGPIGLQLYSLRADFTKNVPTTLDKVVEFGFKDVELAGTYNMAPEKFKELLSSKGLNAVSGHFPFERYRDEANKVAAEAHALGLKYAGCAWIPHKKDFTVEDCENAIKVFNAAGEALAKHGIKFFYHTHGYEFQPHGDGTLFDKLMKETKPELVSYEMDVFWIIHPGQDPVKLLGKYSNRWALLHVKDMKKGTPTGLLTGGTDVSNDVALGTGIMDWPAILSAAKKAGVKYYFIEDESPSVKEQIPVSLKFLETVKW